MMPFSHHSSPDLGPYREGPDHGTASPRGSRSHRRSRHGQGGNDASSDQHPQHQYQDQPLPAQNDNDDPISSRLDKLLGLHTDGFIEAHMDKYDRATNRWKECLMEDWVAGAEGAFFPFVLWDKLKFSSFSSVQNWRRSMARSLIS